MMFVVGLGNPGIQYQKTRHNVGFMALDELAETHGLPPFKLSKKHSSLISEGTLNSIKVVLAKPQTFMNNSGRAVASLVKLSFPKLSLAKELLSLVVIHDDIDIPLGKIKISRGSGSAGHKGVQSIIQALGTKNFTRIRVGIRPATGKPENVEGFVLQKFKKSELPLLKAALQETFASLSSLIKEPG